MAGNPRNGRPWRRLTAEIRRRGEPCWICGHHINLSLDPRHPMSFTVDHVTPLARGGALLDPANLRACHRACNSRKRDRTTPHRPAGPSLRW
ncbi:HNH endonuclease [Streptomyces sp. NPDC059477]|uniref:HNH endonuclease n=1 Tax=Streptomyces sp. NPDC059477 TaxID=3346847 RepID=UPI0036B4C28B